MSESAKVVIWVGCKGWHNFDEVPDEVLDRFDFEQFLVAGERVEGIIVYNHDWDEGISEVHLGELHSRVVSTAITGLFHICREYGIDPDIFKTYIQTDIR